LQTQLHFKFSSYTFFLHDSSSTIMNHNSINQCMWQKAHNIHLFKYMWDLNIFKSQWFAFIRGKPLPTFQVFEVSWKITVLWKCFLVNSRAWWNKIFDSIFDSLASIIMIIVLTYLSGWNCIWFMYEDLNTLRLFGVFFGSLFSSSITRLVMEITVLDGKE